MKFVAAATTALLASSVTVSATTLAGKQLKNNPKFASKLMQDAKPYIQRQLDEGFVITADSSIIFNSCESLTIQADLNDDNGVFQTMNAAGTLKAETSYVLFDVCPTEYCYSNDGSYRSTYIVDMTSFINAFAEFIPSKQEAYCEACQENADYCQEQQQQQYQYQQQQQQQQQNGGGRFLESGQTFEYIDCSRCRSYSCFTDYKYADMDYEYADTEGNEKTETLSPLEWLQQMNECTASTYPTYYMDNTEVRWGFMCNEDGSGVEIAAFLDEDCTLYTNQVSFANRASQTEYNYWFQSKQYIEYIFNTPISCADTHVTYLTPDGDSNGQAYDNSNSGYSNSDGDVSEWCQSVFQSEMEVVSMSDCGYSDSSNNENQQQDNQDNSNNGDYQQFYTLSQYDAADGYSVCTALTSMGGTGEHLYQKSGSGAMYSYQGNNQNSYTGNTYQGSASNNQNSYQGSASNNQNSYQANSQMSDKKDVSAGGIVGWLLGALVVAGVASVGVAYHMRQKKDSASIDHEEPILSTDDKERVIA